MPQAQNGDIVWVNYIGRLDDGSVFDSSEKREPLRFVLGEEGLIPGFQNAVVGMNPGESKTVKLPAEEAFGPKRDEMVLTINRDEVSLRHDPQVGEAVHLEQQDGSPIPGVVVNVTDASITVDVNHPLAGHALTFEISLLEVA